MPPAPRKRVDPTQDTGEHPTGAYVGSQSRVRQMMGRIDWVDVVAGAALSECLDAVGGGGDMSPIHDLLRHLLDMM